MDIKNSYNKRFYIKLTATKSLIIFTAEKVYKFPLSIRTFKALKNEMAGFIEAKKDPFWKNLVIDTKKILFGIALKRCRQTQIQDQYLIEELLEKKLIYALSEKQEHASKLIELSMIKGLTDKKKYQILYVFLENIYLPQTAAHGDLHFDNFVMLNGTLYIIDWNCFKKNSSFVFDYIHYYIRGVCKKEKMSWVKVVFSKRLENIESKEELRHYCGNMKNLFIAYALNRACIEIEQLGGVSNLKSSKRNKYITLINKIIKIINEDDYSY